LIIETLPPKNEVGEDDTVLATLSDADSCSRVFTTQIGLVAEPVAMPAMAAAQRCT
jgi:hypothetical protein